MKRTLRNVKAPARRRNVVFDMEPQIPYRTVPPSSVARSQVPPPRFTSAGNQTDTLTGSPDPATLSRPLTAREESRSARMAQFQEGAGEVSDIARELQAGVSPSSDLYDILQRFR